jgi:phosphomannomutase
MPSSHRFHPSILREYDIRGIVGETLGVEDAFAIGCAFGTVLSPGARVAVGYDGRLSSPELERALVDGLVRSGIEVLRVGRGPTPMTYFASHELGTDGAIHVTGSHNPPNHNGFKFMRGKAPFFGPEIARLGDIALSGNFAVGPGTSAEHPMAAPYTRRLLRDVHLPRPLTVVWDAGNGATGEILQAIVKELPGRNILLNEEIDGRFPAHHPDPTEPHNLVQLQQTVAAAGADLGIAFDGDGDRVGVVDGEGRILWGDQILVLLAEDLLTRIPRATIIADVKASQVFFDEIARMGGNPVMWRTGHSLIKSKMAETGAPLAGEMSGHIFFADQWYGFDDALYAALRLLQVVSSWPATTLAQRRDRLPQMVNTPELRFPCADDRKFAIVEAVRLSLKAKGAEMSEVDGVRVLTGDGWWLLRASNTQAVLVARCEARDQAGLDRLRASLAGHLDACGLELPTDRE